jgi:hypothetical protein
MLTEMINYVAAQGVYAEFLGWSNVTVYNDFRVGGGLSAAHQSFGQDFAKFQLWSTSLSTPALGYPPSSLVWEASQNFRAGGGLGEAVGHMRTLAGWRQT